MKIITITFLFVSLINPSFAQNIGNGGGKGPNQDSLNSACIDSVSRVSILEEEFVQMFELRYKDEKDFTKLLEQIVMNSTFEIINKLHENHHQKVDDTCPDAKKSAENYVVKKRPNRVAEMAILIEIQKIYKSEAKKNQRCPQFYQRIKNIETLEHVIKFYE